MWSWNTACLKHTSSILTHSAYIKRGVGGGRHQGGNKIHLLIVIWVGFYVVHFGATPEPRGAEDYGVLGIKLRLTVCKASVLSAALLLQPHFLQYLDPCFSH